MSETLQGLAKFLSSSERTLYYATQFATKYPDLSVVDEVMSERQNDAAVGTVPDGEWQEVRVSVSDYNRRPYVNIGVFRVEADGGEFKRGISLRHSLWTALMPLIQRAVELAIEREDAGVEREAYGDVLPVHGWRKPR